MISVNVSRQVKPAERPTRAERKPNAVEEICLNCTLPPCNGTCKRYAEEKRKLLKGTS